MAFSVQNLAKTSQDKVHTAAVIERMSNSVCLSERAKVTKGGGAYRQVNWVENFTGSELMISAPVFDVP